MRLLFTALLLGLSLHTFGQGGYALTARIAGLRDSTCYLAHYSGLGQGQFMVKDTARADAAGTVRFSGKTKLPEGLYALAIGQWRVVDLVLDADQHFEFSTDTAAVAQGNPPVRMQVSGSRENELFYRFNHAMQERFEAVQAARGRHDEATARRLQQEMMGFREKFMQENAGTLTVKFLQAAADPVIPPAPPLPGGRPDSTFAYRYFKKHYFDGLDLTDERLLRTPFLQNKIDYYFENLVYQSPDSVARDADALMARTRGRDLRRYVAYRMASRYEQSKIMGMEGAFVHLAEKYYLGEPALWDTATVSQLRRRVATLKPLLTGKKIPDMVQTDTAGRTLHLHEVPADYLLLVFYADDCGHCQTAMPGILRFYEKYKNRGMKVMAVNIRRQPGSEARQRQVWLDFIHKYHLQPFINAADYHRDAAGKPVYYTDYENGFDVQSTPTIYLLDRHKNIIARRLPAEEVEPYFEFYLKRQAAPKAP